jgi:RNA polymerase sigma-70 factor (ECF subfamily)
MASTQSAVVEEMQIRLVRGGDAGAFCELIRPYRRRLYLKTLSIVGNDADAEEVIQNAFLKAFNKISQFRQKASFYTWLFSITVNEARMWLRSSRRHVHEALDNNNEDGKGQLGREIADSREGPFEALERKQVRLRILKALRRLSASHREVVILRDLRLQHLGDSKNSCHLRNQREISATPGSCAAAASTRGPANQPTIPTQPPNQSRWCALRDVGAYHRGFVGEGLRKRDGMRRVKLLLARDNVGGRGPRCIHETRETNGGCENSASMRIFSFPTSSTRRECRTKSCVLLRRAGHQIRNRKKKQDKGYV